MCSQFEEILIALVEKCPYLYDKSEKGYKDEKLKENAWVGIGRKLQCSPETAKKRWENLRNNFVKSFRIYNRKLPSGSARKIVDISFPYFKNMMWLSAHIRKEKMTSSYNKNEQPKRVIEYNDIPTDARRIRYDSFMEESQFDFTQETNESVIEEDNENIMLIVTDSPPRDSPPGTSTDSEASSFTQHETPSPSSEDTSTNQDTPTTSNGSMNKSSGGAKKKAQNEIVTAMSTFTKLLENKMKENDVDERDVFFMQSVCKEMKYIDPRYKLKLKIEIMQLIEKYANCKGTKMLIVYCRHVM